MWGGGYPVKGVGGVKGFFLHSGGRMFYEGGWVV